MAAAVDDFSAPNNATLTRAYQITEGGTPQDITGWSLHAQWRYSDGSLALDLTLENGLLDLVDAQAGQFQVLVQPADLTAVTGGTATIPSGAQTLAYDLLAIPPIASGGIPVVYRPFQGVATITVGSTLAGIA